MILYIRQRDDSIAYLTVNNIYIRDNIVIAAGDSMEDTSTFNKNEWKSADLRADNGQILQVIK